MRPLLVSGVRRQEKRDISALSDEELLRTRIAVEAEMRRRNMEFSVGLMGEKLVIDYFKKTAGLPKLLAAPRGTKNVDAISRDGDRYTIKTLLKAQKTGAIYDEHRDPKKPLFEYLLLVQIPARVGRQFLRSFLAGQRPGQLNVLLKLQSAQDGRPRFVGRAFAGPANRLQLGPDAGDVHVH